MSTSKNRIKVNEEQLKQIISESVKTILNEYNSMYNIDDSPEMRSYQRIMKRKNSEEFRTELHGAFDIIEDGLTRIINLIDESGKRNDDSFEFLREWARKLSIKNYEMQMKFSQPFSDEKI